MKIAQDFYTSPLYPTPATLLKASDTHIKKKRPHGAAQPHAEYTANLVTTVLFTFLSKIDLQMPPIKITTR